jgi:hypothetical protein
MNAFIFVSVICLGQQCEFFTSTKPITEAKCQSIKREFLAMPYKPEVTLVAAQCVTFNEGTKV